MQARRNQVRKPLSGRMCFVTVPRVAVSPPEITSARAVLVNLLEKGTGFFKPGNV